MTAARPVLTVEQVAVLRLKADGHTYASAGAVLGISEAAAKGRCRHAQKSLGTKHVTHTVAVAIRSGLLEEEPAVSTLNSPDSIKSLRETFCVAQTHVGLSGVLNAEHHVQVLQRLVDDCDRQRPLGQDGVHGDLHTATCGCEDKPADGEQMAIDLLVLEAAELVVKTQQAKETLLQRKLRVGFGKAGQLMDRLEQHGVVSAWRSNAVREVLVQPDELDSVLKRMRGEA